ncbi:tRNA1(Val) (adenine(37)-N6)-methyltransferase [Scatolibacter rhodanostii]|uniref:tRNA1(Val) (adenine(37)-N6)-methyltransferase n=1 Tax=Scatolibacter rhodanostii TaxID=2014781 RepID=UPI000C073423|nr:methyltransferase [Scatolibacter rhodanostii]
MNTHETWEPISSEHYILVTPEHHFTTDTILLAHFSAPKAKDICADFGSGCGMIPLLWQIRVCPSQIHAVEIQQNAVEQLQASAKRNGFPQLAIHHADLRNIRSLFTPESLDLISCNPPYKAIGAGLQNEDSSRKTARHEDSLSLDELAKSVRFALKFSGRFCICQRPERLTDAMNIFRQHGLEPKRLRLVQQRNNSKPSLFLLECKKGGKSGLIIEPTLLIEDENGYTAEMLAIYGDYKTHAEKS